MDRAWIAALAVVVFAFALDAQEIRRAALVSDFVETFQPDVGVSGNVVTGVMWDSAAAALPADELAIAPRAGVAGGTLCLHAVSRDGIYASRNEYRLPESPAGARVLLPYRTRHAEHLGTAGPTDLAIAATHGPCGKTAAGYYVAAGGATRSDDRVRVQVNSFGATDVFISLKHGDVWSEPDLCAYLSEGRRTTFDHVCGVDAERVRAGDVSVRILRERFGREQPPVEFRMIGSR
ncbi:MAG: hypothetical protein HKP30_09830 [Myxococcales bacterium]|nr:hypothetical protein [Myxococcales bacterium]